MKKKVFSVIGIILVVLIEWAALIYAIAGWIDSDKETERLRRFCMYEEATVMAYKIDPRITINGPIWLEKDKGYKLNAEAGAWAIFVDDVTGDRQWVNIQEDSNMFPEENALYPEYWEGLMIDMIQRYPSADEYILNIEFDYE